MKHLHILGFILGCNIYLTGFDTQAADSTLVYRADLKSLGYFSAEILSETQADSLAAETFCQTYEYLTDAKGAIWQYAYATGCFPMSLDDIRDLMTVPQLSGVRYTFKGSTGNSCGCIPFYLTVTTLDYRFVLSNVGGPDALAVYLRR